MVPASPFSNNQPATRQSTKKELLGETEGGGGKKKMETLLKVEMARATGSWSQADLSGTLTVKGKREGGKCSGGARRGMELEKEVVK
jgi:hypothetical protein